MSKREQVLVSGFLLVVVDGIENLGPTKCPDNISVGGVYFRSMEFDWLNEVVGCEDVVLDDSESVRPIPSSKEWE